MGKGMMGERENQTMGEETQAGKLKEKVKKKKARDERENIPMP